MLNHGLVGELNEWLGVREGLVEGISRAISRIAGLLEKRCAAGRTYKRPETGTEPSDENDGYNCCQLRVLTA